MTEKRHGELAARGVERRFEPGALPCVEGPANAGVDREQGEVRSLDLEIGRLLNPVGTPYASRSRAASATSLSTSASVVVVSLRSASARARSARRAASGVKKVAAKPSSASYQSWLPGIA